MKKILTVLCAICICCFANSCEKNEPILPKPNADEIQLEEGNLDRASEEVFELWLWVAGDSKLKVIKVVKDITGYGHKEAKLFVDSCPSCFGLFVKEQIEDYKQKLEEAGATVRVK